MSKPRPFSACTSGSTPPLAALITSTPCETTASCAQAPSSLLTRSKTGVLMSEGLRQDRMALVRDLVLQLHDPVDHHLRARRAPGDVDVDRDDAVHAQQSRVVLIEAAAG